MSSTLDLDDLARDIPTSRADLEFFRRSEGRSKNLLPHLDQLTRAVRSLGLRPSRATAEGRAPFELE
ncbi:MAG: hypothetical protein MPN21_13265 [Thermoanaerobaculia bacterium]|nr:hypothetical protein [Thermoanaerobaculia bacterium]